jgi:hypothetical protein
MRLREILRSKATRAIGALLIVALAALAGWWLWTVAAPGPIGSQLGAFATAISALAAAVAAMASWRSAARSDQTSQRAAEALGMAFRPDISGFITTASVVDGLTDAVQETYIEIRNRSQWPAINIHFRYDDGQGWSVEKKFDRIEGGKPPIGQGHRENPAILKALIAGPPIYSTPLADPDWEGKVTVISTTSIEYEDERGFIRWSWIQEHESDFGRKGSIESSGGGPRSIVVTKLT